MASYLFTEAYGGLFGKSGYTAIDYDSDTIQVILCGPACNADSVRHTAVMVDDITLDEYGAVSGYSRKTLGTKTVTLFTTGNGGVIFSSAAISYTALAPSGAPSKVVSRMIFIKNVSSDDSLSPVIAVLNLSDISQTFTGTNNDVTITPPATGWFRGSNNA